MRRTLMLVAAFATFLIPPPVARAADDPRVLLVVSGHGRDSGETQPGFEMDELAQAYLVFADNGLTVDIASPQGGAVVADNHDPTRPYNARFLADPAAKAALDDTLALSTARDRPYGAVFVIGGKGAMFDLPGNTDLQALLARTYDGGGVAAAVCHGPAALVDVRLGDGRLLIEGRAVTGFSNSEERLFGQKWAPQFPFLLEDELRRRGGRFGAADMMLPHVEVDGRLITGQNPYSTVPAAEAVIRALGREPVARTPWTDEASLGLIARVVAGEVAWAAKEMEENAGRYDIPLIGIWGHFRAKAAEEDRAGLAIAVTVMELAAPHVAEPQLATHIADAKAKLDRLGPPKKSPF
ncbi:MAG: hypothetical protein RLY86_822 [Pseudomonadota bacterium]|jgi:putative intracellular protease/amidase